MSLVTYNYLIVDFLNDAVDTSKLYSEIQSSDIITSLDHIDSNNNSCDIFFKASLSSGDKDILDTIVANHDGIPILGPLNVDLVDEYRDPSGKLRVHQTSRKLGLRICWTGVGDDPTDPHEVGNGEPLTIYHTIGGPVTYTRYIDLNSVSNETWIHEGYMTWKDANFDTLTLSMTNYVTGVTISSGTNYNLYGGYMVIPAAPGTGTIDITSDITTHSGGLVYMPDSDLNEAPTAYWNADWNSSTKQYENITPAYAGDGRYNMFAAELTLAKFVREIPLLSSGFIALNSSDTDRIGHGMRLKMVAATNPDVDDHDWAVACILCLHRYSSD